jgi:hypothetical protein
MSQRSPIFSGLSAFQLAAGALAAMTSAWIASALGVAGTIIGAAVGSLVVSVTSAFYANTLHKGRTLVVQTTDGSVVKKDVEEGGTAEAFAEVEEETGSDIAGAEVVEDRPGPPWKRIVVSTAIVLAIALAAIGGYELVSDRSFGNADNTRISNPVSGGGGSGSSSDRQDDGSDGDSSGSDTDGGSDGSDPSQPEPTEQVTPDPEEPAPSTPAPTPDPAQTTPAPAPSPTPAP